MREKDKYVQAAFGSNMDEIYFASWKPGETLIGASDRLSSRVATSGNDHLGRWSWMDIRGERRDYYVLYQRTECHRTHLRRPEKPRHENNRSEALCSME